MKSTVKLMVLGVALSLTGCGQLVGQLSGPAIAKLLKASTVLVKTDGGHGTAFFVRGKSGVCTLLTAAHVVQGKQVVRLRTDDGKERTPQQIFSLDLDLAIMTFAATPDCAYPPLKLGDSDGVEELDPIYISGFPERSGGEPVRQTIPTMVAGFGSLPLGYGIAYKGEVYSGMSGSPVLDRKGKVVAVHGLSDRRLLELYDARRQASLQPGQLATVRQAEERLRSGVLVNTFKWGIPINLYLRSRPAVVVPDRAGISSTFAWLLFGSGVVAGGLLVYFRVKRLAATAEAEGRRRREAEANARTLQEQVRNLEKQLAEAQQQQQEEVKRWRQAEASAERLLEQVQALQDRQAAEPTKTAAPRGEVELKSAKGVDYKKLRDFLAAKDWKKADEETWRVMCLAAGREKEGWLRVEDIDNFPCENLRTIDRLWVKYSDGRFGFSVQKDIYQELGNAREYDAEICWAFGDRVGWRQGGNWLNYDKLNWATNSAWTSPPGHFPRQACDVTGVIWPWGLSSLAQRLVTCNI